MDNYRDDHKATMDALLLEMPGVKGGKAFGYPAYKVNGKVFCFVGGEGIGIKLSKERVAELVAQGAPYRPFEPVAGTVWKAWLSIDRADSDAYREDLPLLEEAMQTVAGA